MNSEDFAHSILAEVSRHDGWRTTDEICQALNLTRQDLGKAFESLKARGELIGLADLWLTPVRYDKEAEALREALAGFHGTHPQEPWCNLSGLGGGSWTAGKPFDRFLSSLGASIDRSGDLFRSRNQPYPLTEAQEALMQRVESCLSANDGLPSSLIAEQCQIPVQAVEGIVRTGGYAGRLLELQPGMSIPKDRLVRLVALMREQFGESPFRAADFRAWHGSTRRFSEPFLHYLDAHGITTRDGNERRLRNAP